MTLELSSEEKRIAYEKFLESVRELRKLCAKKIQGEDWTDEDIKRYEELMEEIRVKDYITSYDEGDTLVRRWKENGVWHEKEYIPEDEDERIMYKKRFSED